MDVFSVIITFGQRYEFHAPINVMMAAEAYVDFMVGIKILRNILNSFNPSSLAASRISCGNDLALCLNSIIKNGVDNVGSKNPKVVFKSPHFENI